MNNAERKVLIAAEKNEALALTAAEVATFPRTSKPMIVNAAAAGVGIELTVDGVCMVADIIRMNQRDAFKTPYNVPTGKRARCSTCRSMVYVADMLPGRLCVVCSLATGANYQEDE